ncbi:hypothetical protein [Jannaschia sp. W003]|uniref:hypothetical protein n=1 Tax=Jannaschia sp. W003 TaxID=2867012 RepID=UPI0021A27696|nr:hypothetical protein [Jannaschia sp. W003]UWQ22095.1 hypothetical protein K3554_03420 [Jannaschia sp. W003]
MTPFAVRTLAATALLALAAPAGADGPPALRFAPPPAASDEPCRPDHAEAEIDDDPEGDEEELTDPDRARFLARDIRNAMRDDPEGQFDFIAALIARRAAVDVDFSEADATLALIDLHLRAGRGGAPLAAAGLVPALWESVDMLGHRERIALARYYSDGVGVERDEEFGQHILRETAYLGSAEALLEIARLQLRGEMVDAWTAPLDLTVTMAFGGLLGALDSGLCRRALRIAREYERGEVVAADAALAFAWRRYAAEMGDADAAWDIVQRHLDAPAGAKDPADLRRYLAIAASRGRRPDPGETARLLAEGVVTEGTLAAILGPDHDPGAAVTVAPHLDLAVNLDTLEPDESGIYLDHLREIALMPEAPGAVFTRIAAELAVRRGRWASEPEAMRMLEEAVRRGDGAGMARLAGMLLRYRHDPARRDRAISLLEETVARFGMAESMDALDGLFRCQLPDAPRLEEAEHWAAAYRATGHEVVRITENDLLALDPNRDPEAIARIQSQALDGRPAMVAAQVQRLEAAGAPDPALRFWAPRLGASRQALEDYAELEFALAAAPDARDLSVEMFRRIYLNNGVTTALDLAIALTEHHARDPGIVKEIAHLLTMAGNRGEGAAIRLLARLEGGDPRAVYERFAAAIEARGDFLAMMFAIPFVPQAKVADYTDRAVSLMVCGTKDADELGDAAAIRGDGVQSHHWRQVGLHFRGGHVLSKLRLSDRQMALHAKGRAPDAAAIAARDAADGEPGAAVEAFRLVSDPALEGYDPEVATARMAELAARADLSPLPVLRAWRRAGPEVRRMVAERVSVAPLLERAAHSGDPAAAYEYAAILRDGASDPAALAPALRWFEEAARAGHPGAMVDAGLIRGLGPALLRDAEAARNWLDRAAALGEPRAADMARMVRMGAGS